MLKEWCPELSSLFSVLLLNSLKGFTNFFVFGTIFDCKIRLLHVRVVNDFMGNSHFFKCYIIAVGNDQVAKMIAPTTGNKKNKLYDTWYVRKNF